MEIRAIHHIGERDNQEDSYYIDPQHRFFIVCDGVGGGEYGKMASTIVLNAAKDWIEEHYTAISENTRWEALADRMSQALVNESKKHTLEKHMGSTAVIAIRKGAKWHILHVGDSRCYHIRPSENYFWRTTDHSLVQELFDAGVITTEEEMDNHPKRNVITRAFTSEGKEETPSLDYTLIPNTKENDIFILCSDGVLEAFPGDALVQALLDGDSAYEDVVDSISERCKSASTDNSTAIVVKL